MSENYWLLLLYSVESKLENTFSDTSTRKKKLSSDVFFSYLKQNECLHARYNSLLLNYVQHDAPMSLYRRERQREKKEKRQKKKGEREKRELFSRLALIANVDDRRQS